MIITLAEPIKTGNELAHLISAKPFDGAVNLGKSFELIAPAHVIKSIVDKSGIAPTVSMVEKVRYTRYPDRDNRDLDKLETELEKCSTERM